MSRIRNPEVTSAAASSRPSPAYIRRRTGGSTYVSTSASSAGTTSHRMWLSATSSRQVAAKMPAHATGPGPVAAALTTGEPLDAVTDAARCSARPPCRAAACRGAAQSAAGSCWRAWPRSPAVRGSRCRRKRRACRARARAPAPRAARCEEARELAEEAARAELRDRALRAALAADQHAAGAHDVEGIALLALVEDHLVGEVFALVQHALHDLELAHREVREQRRARRSSSWLLRA